MLAASRFCCVRFFGGEAQICVLVHLVCIVLPHYLAVGVGVCVGVVPVYMRGRFVVLFVFLSVVVAFCIITDENNICYFKKKKKSEPSFQPLFHYSLSKIFNFHSL